VLSKAKAVPAKPTASVKSAKQSAVSRPAAPSKGKDQAKVTAVATPKSGKKSQAASAPVATVEAGAVHETASTISTGGQQATRSFAVIMQGHAAIAKGIEARKAAAKAKNLARFPRPVVSRTTTTRKLTPAQSKTYEQMLLRLRDELSRQIAFLRGASLTRSDEVNPEEDGSDAFERQLALKLASNEGDAIFEIDEALQRIKDGSYAICQDCGCIISSARLKALPFVRRCIECKRVAEKKRTADDRSYF
jgi:RNA polymerase-binding transcription factor DksA